MVNLLVTILITALTTVGIINYVPLKYLEYFDFTQEESRVGATITTINATDTLKDSRSVINTNFSNLNSSKIENSTTSVAAITTLSNLVTVGALNSGSITTGFGAIDIGADNFTTTGFGNFGNLLLTGSSTLQRLTFTSATGTNATTTVLNSSILTVSSNLGVASTSPSSPLSVHGNTLISGTAFIGGTLTSTSTARGGLTTLTDGASITIDWTKGNTQYVVLGGNRTIYFTATTTNSSMRLWLCQDGTGSRLITWGATMRWAGGSVPTLTTTANKCDIVSLVTATSTDTIFGGASLNY